LRLALPQVLKRGGGVRVGARTRHSAGCPGKAEAQGSIRLCPALTSSGGYGIPGRIKAREPRIAGPARGFVRGSIRRYERQAGQSGAGTPWVPFGNGMLRRAESQERCRHETRPARTRGEKTVERVAKP
jgi:hypothetical protein